MRWTRTDLRRLEGIAQAAGALTLPLFRGEVEVQTKADRSPLTEADLRSHRYLVEALSEWTSDVAVVSEESNPDERARGRAADRFWLIDPLDGTKEFVAGRNEFTVNVAWIEGGRPVAGVVVAPALRRVYSAAERVGAFRDGEAIAADGQAKPLKVVVSRSHLNARTEGFLARLSATAGPFDSLSYGSSLKLCAIAEGAAQLYPRLAPTNEWDTAAADAVVRVAGGRVIDLSGRSLRYGKPEELNPDFVCTSLPDEALRPLLESLEA